MTISVAIAVHNEEQNIIPCLESVYDWVDEIVIVDGTSTDNTIRVIKDFEKKMGADANFEASLGIPRDDQTSSKTKARSHEGGLPLELQNSASSPRQSKIKLIETSNPPMFHINKQKAIETCTKDWILQLDADEVVSTELKKDIQFVIARSEATKQSPIAYWLPRLNYFLGKPLRKGGQYPDYTIRLYKNGVAKFPCKTVHEQVEVRSTETSNEVEELDNNNATGGPTGGGPRQRADTRALAGTREGQAPLHLGYLNSPLLHFPYPTFQEYLNKWHRYNTLEATKLKENGIKPSIGLFIDYFFLKPAVWFFKTYFRHKGFMDGVPGFIFSFFSALRYCEIYLKLI